MDDAERKDLSGGLISSKNIHRDVEEKSHRGKSIQDTTTDDVNEKSRDQNKQDDSSTMEDAKGTELISTEAWKFSKSQATPETNQKKPTTPKREDLTSTIRDARKTSRHAEEKAAKDSLCRNNNSTVSHHDMAEEDSESPKQPKAATLEPVEIARRYASGCATFNKKPIGVADGNDKINVDRPPNEQLVAPMSASTVRSTQHLQAMSEQGTFSDETQSPVSLATKSAPQVTTLIESAVEIFVANSAKVVPTAIQGDRVSQTEAVKANTGSIAAPIFNAEAFVALKGPQTGGKVSPAKAAASDSTSTFKPQLRQPSLTTTAPMGRAVATQTSHPNVDVDATTIRSTTSMTQGSHEKFIAPIVGLQTEQLITTIQTPIGQSMGAVNSTMPKSNSSNSPSPLRVLTTKPSTAISAAFSSNTEPASTANLVNVPPTPKVGPQKESGVSADIPKFPLTANATNANTDPVANAPLPHPSAAMSRPSAISYQVSQHAAHEEAISVARAPLVKLYGTYLCHSADSSLGDARERLKKAIAQTRSLRQSFTERVYGKYRVCLQPPPETDAIIANILSDPVGQHRKFKEEMAVYREEKEIEKKEAAELNNEMNQSALGDRAPVLSNIDNAEQLMFLTAGLNLVILPEDQFDPKLLRGYTDRSPVNHLTGLRVRSISQAAATAGEVILDRTRKASAMRVERQRRRQLQLLRGEVVADGEAESNYSRLQVLSTATSSTKLVASTTAPKTVKSSAGMTAGPKSAHASFRREPTTTSKGGRSRTQASLSANFLLSLNSTADEVKIESKPCASTMALMARGAGPAPKTTQQRLRHPHPESLGGRRRATLNPTSNSNPPEPFLQANLANTLPPLPGTKDRTERNPLPLRAAKSPNAERARKSVQVVIKHFVTDDGALSLRPVSKIRLLNGIRKLSRDPQEQSNLSVSIDDCSNRSANTAVAQNIEKPLLPIPPMNPSLTLSVLHSLGIISRRQNIIDRLAFSVPSLSNENRGPYSGKLNSLRGKIVSEKASLAESLLNHERQASGNSQRKRTHISNSAANDTPSKVARVDDGMAIEKAIEPEEQAVPVESICGGGGINNVIKGSSDKSETSTIAVPAASVSSTRGELKKRKRAESSPDRLSHETAPRIQAEQGQAHILPRAAQIAYLGSQMEFEQYNLNSTMNAFHIVNQLHHLHHPAAGDLAEYLSSFQQQRHGNDLPSIMSGAAQSHLSALGFMHHNDGLVGYTLQDSATAARAMLVGEQQAAALLGGYPPQPTSGYHQLGPHHVTASAFLGTSAIRGPQHAHVANSEGHQHAPPLPSHANETKKSQGRSEVFESNKDERIGRFDSVASKKPRLTQVQTSSTLVKSDKVITSDNCAPGIKALMTESRINGTRGQGDMKFIAPIAPATLATQQADYIRSGLFHQVAAELDQSDYEVALDYLLSVGAAVPIPKGLVLGPLKERLNTPGFKNAGSNCAPPITRDVVAAVILIWLWATHERIFQVAFEKNGRIDVDPESKWLVQAAVDTAVCELSLEIAESMARGEGVFAEASAARKANPVPQSGAGLLSSQTVMVAASRKLDVRTASIANHALTVEMSIDEDMNLVIPRYSLLVEFLDEARLCALRTKAQERTLLATLIARKATMTENFSHAYVSSMVRAGEALGHGRLFEIAQDEDVMASTMIPYDIFTDDSGSWEDPCKPDNGFTTGLTGDDLMRRAHARAMIQKSLKKLQDRHHIRGGTSIYGPYKEPAHCESSTFNAATDSREQSSSVSPRPLTKRRLSAQAEPHVALGTGSAAAKSWAVFDPKHICSPLEWEPDDLENSPYGLHFRGEIIRAMSMVAGRSGHDVEWTKTKKSMNLSTSQLDSVRHKTESDLVRSTREIDWADVASIFQSVELPRKSARYKALEPEKQATADGTIFAPFCRQRDDDLSDNEDESDTDEDLSEATILMRHHGVLDEMKAKLEAFLEARKKQQESRKNRYSK